MSDIYVSSTRNQDVQITEILFGYAIGGYTDPITGRYSDDTSWTLTTTDRNGQSSYSGHGGADYQLTTGIPAPEDGQMAVAAYDFTARNDASGETVTLHVDLQAAVDAGVEFPPFIPVPQTLTGSDGSDFLVGAVSDDVLRGLGGNDIIIGGGIYRSIAGADSIDGGAGDDQLTGSGTLVGGSGNDYLNGTGMLDGGSGDDQIVGTGTLLGGAGNDFLVATGGSVSLEGGPGADYLGGSYLASTLVSYAHSPGAVVVDLASQSASGGDADGDTLSGIESAQGSEFDDSLSGDGNANHLFGGGGADMLRGGGGNDTIVGGIGADTMGGGAGTDTLSYAGSSAGVTVDIAAGAAAGGDAAGDRFAEFENLRGSSFADTLGGDGGANILFGDAGDDVLDGQGGNDLIEGGAGADRLAGGAGIDTLAYKGDIAGVSIDLVAKAASGGDAAGDVFSGFENVIGGAGADRLIGDSHGNSLVGNAGDDTILAGAGNDYVDGGRGSNVLSGGSGIDRLSYSSARNAVSINLATGSGNHSDGSDTVSQFENLVGSRFGDYLIGDNGSNLIDGLGGDDQLDGRKGDDVLTGGDGRDSFLFRTGYGHDRIADFSVGAGGEQIRLVLGPAYDSYREVMAAAHVSRGDTVFDFGGGDTLTLTGVTPAQLSAGNFLYG
ncbi:calcium-binding protein [Sphingomonas sp.]|uniref:calcium-binding protein n=1 Tax=Sphingomonas sp. TaxID=28214 RepID=UPI003B00540F